MSRTDDLLENRTFAEIAVGDAASLTRAFARDDVDFFALITGDAGPSLVDGAKAIPEPVTHGWFSSGLIASVLGTKCPGLGTIYLEQALKFLAPVEIGDSVTATVTAKSMDAATSRILFDCQCINQNGTRVAQGTALVVAPAEKIRLPRTELPDVQLSRHQRFRALLARTAGLAPLATAIAYPCDANAIGAAVEAAKAGLDRAHPGGAARQNPSCGAGGEGGHRALSPGGCARQRTCRPGRRGAGDVRRSAASDEGLAPHRRIAACGAVTAQQSSRAERRLSHVYLFDVPSYPKPLLVTDAAVNIYPDVEDKRDIVQNAIDLAHVMGIAQPKVAILSAVETINPKIKSTVDAATLCKMAERGQITGGVLDGPLAFDNAISPAAAAEKGIVSPVAGQADILLVPDLEAGNMLAKQLSFLAGADAAGVVLGARVPIILTSRADAERTRMASCAVAVLIAQAQKIAT